MGRPEERLREIERLLVRALKIPARYVTSSSAPAEKCQLVRFLVTLPGMRQPTNGEITCLVCDQTSGSPRQLPCVWASVCLTASYEGRCEPSTRSRPLCHRVRLGSSSRRKKLSMRTFWSHSAVVITSV